MLGFIIALIAGFLTPHAEAPLAQPIVKALQRQMEVAPGELRLIAFVIMLLLAGIASALLDSGSAFWVTVGVSLGYFGVRLTTAARKAIEDRRNR